MMASLTVSRGMSRTHFDSDLSHFVYTFRQRRCEAAPNWCDDAEHGKWKYRGIPRFCMAGTMCGIGKHGFVLTPARYQRAESQEIDGEPLAEKYTRLRAELKEWFDRGERSMGMAQTPLRGLNDAV